MNAVHTSHPISRLALLLIACLLGGQESTYSQQNPGQSGTLTLSPFTALGRNTVMCFEGSNILLHTSAIAATALLVRTDADYTVNQAFLSRNESGFVASTALWVGYGFPFALGGGIWTYGHVSHDDRMIAAGSAALQSSLIAVMYGTLLKAITGRPGPDPEGHTDLREASRTFQFGFLRGGVHYGWPSGHLMTNTAAVTSLLWFYPENHLLKILGTAYLAYLAWGVLAHDRSSVHWFSDVVAGTLMGYAIGSTVGRSFRERWEQRTCHTPDISVNVTPVVAPSFTAVSIVIRF